MQYRQIKKTGDELSVLGFGCMRFPLKNGGIDEQKAEHLILRSIELGVNYFDTAFPYHAGASESLLGRIISRHNLQSRIKLATKLPIYMVQTRDDMDRFLNTQLTKLQSKQIDYYLLHNVQSRELWTKMLDLGVLEFLETAKADGRIRYAGFSYHGDRGLFKEVTDAYDWDLCQLQYNILDVDNQAGTEGLLYAAQKGMGIVIMEPLRGGNLAGKVPRAVQAIWDRAETKRTPVEWALGWLWNHPQIHVVLSGMSNTVQLEENAQIASSAQANLLTANDLQLVSEVRSTYRKLMKVGCTGCNYCLPCPAGVNIPQCFERYNNKYLFQVKGKLAYYMWVGGLISNPSYASLCIECGKCEKLCPQGIAIRSELKQVAKEMEGRFMKQFIWLGKKMLHVFSRRAR